MTRFAHQVLSDDKAPAFALLAVALSYFGAECFDWTPEFLKDEISHEFDVKLTDINSDKLQAAITILTTDTFESQHEVFETCCHLLNNQPDTFEDFSPLEAEEIASALVQVRMITEGDDERLHFSDEVRAYAGLSFHAYGMCKAPDIMPTAIMPESPSDCTSADTDKNTALLELSNAKTEEVKAYLETLFLPTRD